jgi:hypothetical protein
VSFDISDRGFKQYEPTMTDRGHEVRIYESSAAMKPCLWIAAERTQERCQGGLEPEGVHIHVTLEEAQEIHEKLGAAIANHYQSEFEGRPRHKTWADDLLRRDNVQGRKTLERMVAFYEENDGRADDFGELWIVKDARSALEATS